MSRTKAMLRVPVCAALAAVLSPSPPPLRAQDMPRMEASFEAEEWLSPGSSIELRLSDSLPPGAGSLALFIDGTDFTALADISAQGVRYRPGAVQLPVGESEVIVFLVAPSGEWQEIVRTTLRVLTPRGFREAQIDPRLDIANEGQVAEGHSPSEPAAGRSTWQYGTVNSGIDTRHVRGVLSLTTRFNGVGVTERERALRFGERQDRAPRFDLADYLITLESPHVALTAGNVSFGANRHLINSYSTRGINLTARVGEYAQLGVGAMSGRSIVGWHRMIGIGEARSRILSATMGLEAAPDRPGLFRVEGTVMDGRVPGRSGFSQGSITDVETNRGAGIRITAADPSQRLTLDAGFARSRFDNPPDQLLSRGAELVPLHGTTRNARYVDAGVHVLRAVPLTSSLPASLMLAFRHERVDPLYRSVALYTAADVEQNAVEASASLGPVSMQVSHGRGRDNLDRIASILETHTRDTRAAVNVPIATVLGSSSRWLPQAAYSFSRVHQFGAGVPPNSGFEPGHVPDQLSDSHGARLDWQLGAIGFGYQLDHSHQDNRQPGREQADFRVLNHAASVSLMSQRGISLMLNGGVERAASEESGEVVRGRRGGASADVRVTGSTSLSLQGTFARSREQLTGLLNEAITAQAQLAQRVTLLRRRGGATSGQIFVRFSGSRMEATGLDSPAFRRNAWTVNTGANLSVF